MLKCDPETCSTCHNLVNMFEWNFWHVFFATPFRPLMIYDRIGEAPLVTLKTAMSVWRDRSMSNLMLAILLLLCSTSTSTSTLANNTEDEDTEYLEELDDVLKENRRILTAMEEGDEAAAVADEDAESNLSEEDVELFVAERVLGERKNEASDHSITPIISTSSEVSLDELLYNDDSELSVSKVCMECKKTTDMYSQCEQKNHLLCSARGRCERRRDRETCCVHLLCNELDVQTTDCKKKKKKHECDKETVECDTTSLDKYMCSEGRSMECLLLPNRCCRLLTCDSRSSSGLESNMSHLMVVQRDVCNRSLCPNLPQVCPKGHGWCSVTPRCFDNHSCFCEVEVGCDHSHQARAFDIHYEIDEESFQDPEAQDLREYQKASNEGSKSLQVQDERIEGDNSSISEDRAHPQDAQDEKQHLDMNRRENKTTNEGDGQINTSNMRHKEVSIEESHEINKALDTSVGEDILTDTHHSQKKKNNAGQDSNEYEESREELADSKWESQIDQPAFKAVGGSTTKSTVIQSSELIVDELVGSIEDDKALHSLHSGPTSLGHESKMDKSASVVQSEHNKEDDGGNKEENDDHWPNVYGYDENWLTTSTRPEATLQQGQDGRASEVSEDTKERTKEAKTQTGTQTRTKSTESTTESTKKDTTVSALKTTTSNKEFNTPSDKNELKNFDDISSELLPHLNESFDDALANQTIRPSSDQHPMHHEHRADDQRDQLPQGDQLDQEDEAQAEEETEPGHETSTEKKSVPTTNHSITSTSTPLTTTSTTSTTITTHINFSLRKKAKESAGALNSVQIEPLQRPTSFSTSRLATVITIVNNVSVSEQSERSDNLLRKNCIRTELSEVNDTMTKDIKERLLSTSEAVLSVNNVFECNPEHICSNMEKKCSESNTPICHTFVSCNNDSCNCLVQVACQHLERMPREGQLQLGADQREFGMSKKFLVDDIRECDHQEICGERLGDKCKMVRNEDGKVESRMERAECDVQVACVGKKCVCTLSVWCPHSQGESVERTGEEKDLDNLDNFPDEKDISKAKEMLQEAQYTVIGVSLSNPFLCQASKVCPSVTRRECSKEIRPTCKANLECQLSLCLVALQCPETSSLFSDTEVEEKCDAGVCQTLGIINKACLQREHCGLRTVCRSPNDQSNVNDDSNNDDMCREECHVSQICADALAIQNATAKENKKKKKDDMSSDSVHLETDRVELEPSASWSQPSLWSFNASRLVELFRDENKSSVSIAVKNVSDCDEKLCGQLGMSCQQVGVCWTELECLFRGGNRKECQCRFHVICGHQRASKEYDKIDLMHNKERVARDVDCHRKLCRCDNCQAKLWCRENQCVCFLTENHCESSMVVTVDAERGTEERKWSHMLNESRSHEESNTATLNASRVIVAEEVNVRFVVRGLIASELSSKVHLECSREELCPKTNVLCDQEGRQAALCVVDAAHNCGNGQCVCNVHTRCPDKHSNGIDHDNDYSDREKSDREEGLRRIHFQMLVSKEDLEKTGLDLCLQSCYDFGSNCTSAQACHLRIDCFHDHCICHMRLECALHVARHQEMKHRDYVDSSDTLEHGPEVERSDVEKLGEQLRSPRSSTWFRLSSSSPSRDACELQTRPLCPQSRQCPSQMSKVECQALHLCHEEGCECILSLTCPSMSQTPVHEVRLKSKEVFDEESRLSKCNRMCNLIERVAKECVQCHTRILLEEDEQHVTCQLGQSHC